MRYLKFWSIIALFLGISVELTNGLFFHSSFAGFVNPFTESMPYAFNALGIYFGITGTILWVGGLTPLSNATMAFLLFIGYCSYWLQFFIDPLNAGMGTLLGTVLWPIGVASLLYYFIFVISRIFKFSYLDNRQSKEYAHNFIYLIIITMSLGVATSGALDLSTVILPKVLDFDLYKMDAFAYNNITSTLYSSFQHSTSPFWQTTVTGIYSLLSIVLFLAISLVLREKRGVQINALRVLIGPFIIAFLLYCITPVAGPIYTYGADYPDNMDWIINSGKEYSYLSPSLRNGMPSMHFTGAMLIVLVTACLTRKIFLYASCIFTVITFIATIGMGEHYLVDIVVAAPFCIALGTALLNPPGWNFWRRRIWWLCALLFVAWELLLHFDTTRFFLVDNIWFVRLLSLISILSYLYGFAAFLRVVWHLPAPTESEWRAALEAEYQQPTAVQVPTRWVYGLFVCSGFAGLLYEVVFAKHLGVIFGGTALAAYTVMATYMGGVALGAWLGGIIADRVRAPLKWYALFEGAIGLYALATPALFKLIEHVYVALATDVHPDAPLLTFWRVTLGALVLGIPTLLMGTTLPLMFKFLRGYLASRGRIISRLYTANIIGAALGALLGAYLVLPTFGLLSSTRLAALLSLMIALYALDRLKALPAQQSAAVSDDESAESGYVVLPPQGIEQHRRLGIAALLLVTVGGVVSLALEIVNIHMLAVVAGNSVYAFGLMLATFLLGLGLGSVCYGKLRYLLTDPAVAAIAQLGIFFTIVISAFQWDGLSNYFASFGMMQEYHHFGFGAREVIRGSVCAIIMMPPAFFIGLGYPATMALAADWLKNRGEATGLGIASLGNTLGNIAGVLLAGFVFLNLLGSNRLLFGLAVISLLLALYMAWAGRIAWPLLFNQHRGRQRLTTAITAALVVTALWGYPAQWNLTSIANGANVYFEPLPRGEVIDAQESIQGGLTTVNEAELDDGNEKATMLTLLTNGKFQGNNDREIAAQQGIAEAPLLHQGKRDDVLVIGYGTGHSAQVLNEYGFAHMDIVELSPDIVALADRHFSDINGKVSQQANVQMYYTDGRNYLLTQNKRYDLISMELNSIWFAGAANLYNREFYHLLKPRLQENGVLQQWVQLHHMQTLDLLYILNTLHQEYRYVWLYVIGKQGVLIASDSADAARLYHLDGSLAEDEQALTEKEKSLRKDLVWEPEDFVYLAEKLRVPQYFVATDNNLYLEYATPKGNALDYQKSLEHNLKILRDIRNERIEHSKHTAQQPIQ